MPSLMPMRSSEEFSKRGLFQPIVGSKLFLAQDVRSGVLAKTHRCFKPTGLVYYPFCDDFGPMNFASVTQFVELLEAEIDAFPTSKIVYFVESGRRALTNAIFLLGSYMIFKLNRKAEQVWKSFSWVDSSLVEPFRDATFSKPDFGLTLLDCWRGLERGKANGWVDLPPKGSKKWGLIDIEEHTLYDDPNQADLHEVVPRKLVAFKGPMDLGEKEYFDDKYGYRHFSPDYYAQIFEDLGVSTVVRLNESHYDASAFAAHGMSHHNLEFDDCTSPPSAVVDAFFKIVDSAPAMVAVHCKAGLGRTGTLIALYMMRVYSFSAREAMGWLRVMRPGSVIGEQQHFLCEVERSMRQVALQHEHPLLKMPPTPPGKALRAASLAAQVACGMERRGAARIRDSHGASGALPAINRPTR